MASMIWIPSPTEAWEPVIVVSSDINSVTVKRRTSPQDFKVSGNIVNYSSLTAESLEENCENLVDLETYNEGIILHHIKKRFATDTIYTLVSNILIALNPYKPIDIYGSNVIDRIYNKVKRGEEAPPHVFSIAAAAVHRAKEDGKDQSVLISGESGAGKTEATKKILQFISTVCASNEHHSSGHSVENQILDTNPLLESFGNAKTIRNNNSSRFGKYMEVNFDKRFHIQGCQITAYLLEKSRVVRQGPNERNYHVFYMLLAGANKEWRRDFFLKPADEFAYLSQSGCTEIDRRSELKEFDDMIFAMQNLSINHTQQAAIFQALAAILHMGNLQFQASRDVEGGSKVTAPAEARRVASLLGVDADSLERVFCHKDATINGESLLIPLTPEKAVDQRDSLAKFVYAKLFDFIVLAANTSLFKGKSGVNIGVLDIFGFEVFQHNSFEQLCINYCNERLQTFFNEVIFDGEMKLYHAEGLPIDDITYQDNLGCVRLIDLRGAGLFAYLDEECSVPKGSDEKYVSKINMIFDETAATKSVFFHRNHKSALNFTIRHFAGDVHYNARDFLDKNRDALPEGLLNIVARSTVLNSLIASSETGGTSAASAPVKGGAGGGKKSTGKLTLSAKFKSDLDALMTTLRATQPHFIRCIKPNLEQVPIKFDAQLALNQLKYSGLFEAIRIRKAGYEVRIPHEQFLRRYRHCTLSIAKATRESGDRVEYTKVLLEFLVRFVDSSNELQAKRRLLEKAAAGTALGRQKQSQSQQQQQAQPQRREVYVGATRVFLRSQVLKVLFDEVREQTRGNLIAPIQALVRGHLARERLRARLALVRLSPEERLRQREREQAETRLMAEEDALALALETIVRGDKGLQERIQRARQQKIQEEREKQRLRRFHAATCIQRIVRGCRIRHAARIFLCEQLLERVIAQRAHLHRQTVQGGNGPPVVAGDLQSVRSGATTTMSSLSPTHGKHRRHRQLALEDFVRYEQELQRALVRPQAWRVTSKLIVFYSREVRKILLQLLEEMHVEQALRDAVQVQSLPLLKEALESAHAQQLSSYLPSFRAAQETVQRLQSQRAVLALIAEHLAQSTSVSRLLSVHYDALRWLIAQAVSVFGLHREDVVRDAVHRLKQTQALFELRQALRRSVEICAPQTMRTLMVQRRKHVKFFGEDFLQEEAVAVENMLHLLSYQQSQFASDGNGSSSSNGGGGGSGSSSSSSSSSNNNSRTNNSNSSSNRSKMNMHEIYSAVIRPVRTSTSASASMSKVQSASNLQDADDARKAAAKFVGIDSSVGADVEQKNDSLPSSSFGARTPTPSTPAVAEGAEDEEEADGADGADEEAIYLPRFVREPLQRLRQANSANPPDVELAKEAQAEFTALVPHEFAQRFYSRVFKWAVAFATWHKALETVIQQMEQRLAQHILENSASNPHGSVQFPLQADDGLLSHLGLSYHGPSSPSRLLNTNMTVATLNKPASNAQPLGRRTFASGETHKAAKRSQSPAKATGTGPFAQRMTKSEVAAREVLKKGQKMTFRNLTHRTDTLISSTMKEYGETKKLVQKKSTF